MDSDDTFRSMARLTHCRCDACLQCGCVLLNLGFVGVFILVSASIETSGVTALTCDGTGARGLARGQSGK